MLFHHWVEWAPQRSEFILILELWSLVFFVSLYRVIVYERFSLILLTPTKDKHLIDDSRRRQSYLI